MNKLIKEFNLEKIKRKDTDGDFEKIVEDANARVVERERNPRLKIGRPDAIIIGGFLREKINFVHTSDKGFEKTCLELKINVLPVPERDFKKEKEIKKWMKKRR